MPKVSASDDAPSTNPAEVTQPAAPPHRCPSWCTTDEAWADGAVFHDSTPMRFEWWTGDSFRPEQRWATLSVKTITYSTPEEHHEARIFIDGVADHEITTSVDGLRGLRCAIDVLLARVGDEH